MPKLENLSHYLLKRRKHIARESVGRLHDQCLGVRVSGRLGTCSLPEFEVARVEEASLLGFDKTLG